MISYYIANKIINILIKLFKTKFIKKKFTRSCGDFLKKINNIFHNLSSLIKLKNNHTKRKINKIFF